MDALLQAMLSNVLVALPLALAAAALQRWTRRQGLAHMLWVFVLLKLLTPPLVTTSVDVLPVSSPAPTAMQQPLPPAAVSAAPAPALLIDDWRQGLAVIWLLGSSFCLIWSVVHVLRFDRRIRAASRAAPRQVQVLTRQLAAGFGLTQRIDVRTVPARIPPIVWWLGGRVRIFLPESLVAGLETSALRAVLAHEMAHVSRRDHWVRWLEWLASIACWWNPLLWWTRHNLRLTEEICCDELALRRLDVRRTDYGLALVSAMDLLTSSRIRPVPPPACAMSAGHSMERRFTMIASPASNGTSLGWLGKATLIAAAALLPLGFVASQPDELASVERWLDAGVNSAFVTEEQKAIMLDALRQNLARKSVAQTDSAAQTGPADPAALNQWADRVREIVPADLSGIDVTPTASGTLQIRGQTTSSQAVVGLMRAIDDQKLGKPRLQSIVYKGSAGTDGQPASPATGNFSLEVVR